MDAKRGIAIGMAVLAYASIATGMATAARPTLTDSGSDESVPLLQPTPFQTPTPNAQGAILYIVLDGDSLWRIAAIAEISVEELMALNGIQSGDFISPGMELVLPLRRLRFNPGRWSAPVTSVCCFSRMTTGMRGWTRVSCR